MVEEENNQFSFNPSYQKYFSQNEFYNNKFSDDNKIDDVS